MKIERFVECIKSKLASEGVNLRDRESAVRCLSACVSGKRLVEVYEVNILGMHKKVHSLENHRSRKKLRPAIEYADSLDW